MKNNSILIFILSLIISSSCGNSREIELKLNLEKGKKYQVNMIVENTVDANGGDGLGSNNFTMDVTMDYDVIDKLPNGNFLVRNTYKTYNMKIMGIDVSSHFQELVGEYFEMEFTPQNKLIKTTVSPNLTKLGMKSESLGEMDNIVYPDKKIKVGETWESNIEVNRKGIEATMKTNSKLISVKDGIADIQQTGTVLPKDTSNKSYSATLNANYKIELATGLKREAIIDVTSEMQTDESVSPSKHNVKATVRTK